MNVNNIQVQYTILLFIVTENIILFLQIFDFTNNSTAQLQNFAAYFWNFTAHQSAAGHRLEVSGLGHVASVS
jgi:hypothetical protein